MAKLTKGQLTDMAREKYISMISDFLAENGEEILRVGKNAISFPIVLEGCIDLDWMIKNADGILENGYTVSI